MIPSTPGSRCVLTAICPKSGTASFQRPAVFVSSCIRRRVRKRMCNGVIRRRETRSKSTGTQVKSPKNDESGLDDLYTSCCSPTSSSTWPQMVSHFFKNPLLQKKCTASTSAHMQDLEIVNEAQRLNELVELSRKPLFEESSSDEESVASVQQLQMVESLKTRRHGNDNRICKYRPSCIQRARDRSIESTMQALRQDGMLAVRAKTSGFTRKELRASSEVREVFPRWFASCASIRTWKDCESLIAYLATQHGGLWKSCLSEFVADHPLPDERSSPMLQNMRCRDFMHVALFYALKKNHCAASDLQHCANQIGNNFRKALLHLEK